MMKRLTREDARRIVSKAQRALHFERVAERHPLAWSFFPTLDISEYGTYDPAFEAWFNKEQNEGRDRQ
jgi:hypothetical protein